MSQVELVVEICGGFSESCHNLLVDLQGGFDDWGGVLLNGGLEFFQMTVQKGRVNQEQRLVVWERYADCPEMSLITRVHEERTG